MDESSLFLNSSNSICGHTEECGIVRFVLVTSASILAMLGTGANVILAYIFIFRTFPSTPPTLYPTFLAILDTLICSFYVLFFGVDVMALFLKNEVGSKRNITSLFKQSKITISPNNSVPMPLRNSEVLVSGCFQV